MPELPEVEVTRLSFADRIRGARIERLKLGKPLRWPLGIDSQRLAGRRVLNVTRRGKYLLMHLDQGCLLWHLGMSGALNFQKQLPPAGPHDHADLITDLGVLRLHDPRRFGAVVHVDHLDDAQAIKLLGGLGVEPLEGDFDPKAFHAALKQRRAPIKQVLLAGDIVVGVGNIYASESLFHAGIRPTKTAGKLTQAECARLAGEVKRVLGDAIEVGGTTLRDYVDPEGNPGYFRQRLFVYERAGKACRRCWRPGRRCRAR